VRLPHRLQVADPLHAEPGGQKHSSRIVQTPAQQTSSPGQSPTSSHWTAQRPSVVQVCPSAQQPPPQHSSPKPQK
jgi:hypothetical protein